MSCLEAGLSIRGLAGGQCHEGVAKDATSLSNRLDDACPGSRPKPLHSSDFGFHFGLAVLSPKTNFPFAPDWRQTGDIPVKREIKSS